MRLNSFFTTQTVWLTPISPLHVGCGEEYDPTSYVLRDGLLYAFEPGLVVLDDADRNALLRVARNSVSDVAAFFDAHADDCMGAARSAFPADSEITARYKRLLDRSRSGSAPKNGFGEGLGEVFRTAYVRNGDSDVPYVPGSSVKGAVHTAMLDKHNAGRPVRKGDDAEIFNGTFEKSPMRAFKVGDFMPTGDVPRRAVMAKRMHKEEEKPGRSSIPAAFEIVEAGAYRAFSGEWSLMAPEVLAQVSANVQKPMGSIREIAATLNQRNRPIFRKELEQLSVSGRSRDWVGSATELLNALQPDLDAGHAALVRLGKNQGAESLVLSGGVAKIGRRKATKSYATTQWFVTNNGVVPFGWCILEFGSPIEALKAWCGKQRKAAVVDLEAARRARLEKAACIEAQAKAQAQRRAEAEALAREEEARKQAMTPEERQTEETALKLEKFAGAVKPGTDLFREVWDLLALAEGWPTDAQKSCAARLSPLIKKREMYQGKYEKLLKQQLRKLRNEG